MPFARYILESKDDENQNTNSNGERTDNSGSTDHVQQQLYHAGTVANHWKSIAIFMALLVAHLMETLPPAQFA